ncbi:MAG: DUF2179 domain-containing protein [Chloroflexi bacterium]|nr:MAG: hypothetical protein CUN54_04410 [Phototrophicales bacterium]RMF77729.1 MAG: DUF2179 domain-containing protein [Chloroflexota bacterium]
MFIRGDITQATAIAFRQTTLQYVLENCFLEHVVMSSEAILLALAIFALRFLNSALATVRMIMVTQHRRWLSSVIATIEAVIFAVTVAGVVNDLTNILNLGAYAFGFGFGSYVGIMIEERFITGFVAVNIITPNDGHSTAELIRSMGHAVTETVGEGRDGQVCMLRSVINRRDAPGMIQHIKQTNTDAFISVEEARAVHRGWLRAMRAQKS